MFPGTLLPVPILLRISASRLMIVPNCACPSARGGATDGTVMSWIIQPSYQPLSLLMTNNGEMSVKTSLKSRGSFGSVGSPGLGSNTTRTAPTVGRPQFPPVAVNCTFPPFTPGIMAVKTLGSKTVGVQQVVLEQLTGAVVVC